MTFMLPSVTRRNQPKCAIVFTVIWGAIMVITTYKITGNFTFAGVYLGFAANIFQKTIFWAGIRHDFPEFFAEGFATLSGPEDVAEVKKLMCWREPTLRFLTHNGCVHPNRSLAFQTILTTGLLSGW